MYVKHLQTNDVLLLEDYVIETPYFFILNLPIPLQDIDRWHILDFLADVIYFPVFCD